MKAEESKIIEMVCLGNLGRSRVAEKIAKRHFSERGIEKYLVESSGTMVNEFGKGPKGKWALNLLDQANRKRIYDDLFEPYELRAIEEAKESSDFNVIEDMALKVVNWFNAEERLYLNELLSKGGLGSIDEKVPSQTIPRKNVSALFCMGNSIKEQVQEIYQGSNFNPLIKSIYDHIDGGLPAWGKEKKDYEKMFSSFVEFIPKSLDEFICKNKKFKERY